MITLFENVADTFFHNNSTKTDIFLYEIRKFKQNFLRNEENLLISIPDLNETYIYIYIYIYIFIFLFSTISIQFL